jgi:uncharacterized protein (TIGR00730 family)
MAAICVYCASSERIERRYVDLAAEAGTELARRGHSLVTGGSRASMMGAVARAARAGGAKTVGVIPAGLISEEVADTDSDELVRVATMRDRKAEMDDRADAFLALPGGVGTLEELLEVWTTRTLVFHTKPVVVLDPVGFYAPLLDWVGHLVGEGFVRRRAVEVLRVTRTVAEALDACEEGLTARAPVNGRRPG